MQFPNKIKFIQTNIIGELKDVLTKDNKGVKLTVPIGVYEYLDNGVRIEGKIDKGLYASPKIGSRVSLSLELLVKLEGQYSIEILE